MIKSMPAPTALLLCELAHYAQLFRLVMLFSEAIQKNSTKNKIPLRV